MDGHDRTWLSSTQVNTEFSIFNYEPQNSNPDLMCILERNLAGLRGQQNSERYMDSNLLKGKCFQRSTFRDINLMAEEAKRRAQIARLRELHTLKGKVESFAKLKGLDIDAINQNYTV